MLVKLKTNRAHILEYFKEKGYFKGDITSPLPQMRPPHFINILNVLEYYLFDLNPSKRDKYIQSSLILYKSFNVIQLIQMLQTSKEWLIDYFRSQNFDLSNSPDEYKQFDRAYSSFLTDLLLHRTYFTGKESGKPTRFSKLNLYYRAFQQSSDTILITDEHGTLIDVNRAFLELYGYKRNEVIGKTTSFLRSSRSRDQFYREMWQSVRDHREWKGEIYNKCKCGKEIFVWLSITAICENERVVGYLGVQIDLTERKEMEKRLLQSERMAMVGQMSAKVTHEIRNPLSSITLNCELLEDEIKNFGIEKASEAINLLKIITTETDRLTKLLNEYLQFTRLPQSIPERCDLVQIVDEELDFLVPGAAQKQIQIHRSYPEERATCQIDSNQIRRIIINLAENAFAAMPQGGEIFVAIKRIDQELVLEFRDTGKGIPEENQEKVFDPFYTDKLEGTGLGLSIVQQIVHENKGTITLRSRLDQGAAFEIRFGVFH